MNINQHDLSDDELDHVFRNAAENIGFDFEADSWTKMSQKLDAINLPASGKNQVKNSWLKRSLSLLLVLLLMIGTYYLINSSSEQTKSKLQTKHKNSSENERNTGIKKDNKVDTSRLKNNVSKQKSSSEKTINSSESIGYEREKIETKITIESKIEKTEVISVNKKTLVSSKNQKSGIAKNEKTSNQTFTKNTKVFKTKPKHDLTKAVISETSLVVREDNINTISDKKETKNNKSNTNSEKNGTQISKNNTIANQTPISQNIPLSHSITNTDGTIGHWQLGNIKNLTPKNSIFKANFNLPIITFEVPKVEPTIPTSKSTSFKKGLNLRLSVSPDFSIVTVDEIARLGSNWVALLEYRFNNRFSLHTGVIRSTKYYDSYPESYEWPSNWSQPPILIDINATCKMLDIPLNVRYDITQKTNSRWFVSSGLTSYVMLNEKYTYNYENPSDPKIKWRDWQGKTGPYYFSVLNFSFGYEHQLFRRLSLQAEPFLKVPIGKVGFGKVNLSTIGIFISAKYPIARF